MNSDISGDLAEFDRQEKMQKVRKIFFESWEQDIVRFWFDEFPEGPSLILGVSGNTDSSDSHTALGFDFHGGLFEKEYRNWSSVAKDILKNIDQVPWYAAGYEQDFEEKDMEPSQYFEGKDEIELLKAFITKDQVDPLFLFRENANPMAKWLMDCRGF